MAEVHEPGVLATPKRRRSVKVIDIVIFGVILVVIIVLVVTLVSKLQLKHEVAQARIVADKVTVAIAKDDAAGVRALGDAKFQADHQAANLSNILKPIAEIYGDTTPKVDKQIVANTASGQHVAIIYRYDRLKLPFYIRVDTAKAPGSSQWKLQAFSGNPDETQLTGQ